MSKTLEKVSLGRTNLAVTRLCFGFSSLGDMPATYGYGISEARARATLHAIFDSPVNFLDTSRNYGLGRSEARIGAAIRERGGLPDGFVLASKLDRDNQSNRFDAARARRSLEQSLTALGIDRIPLLHLHDPEHAASLNEVRGANGALPEIFRMKDEGLIDAVGLAAGDTTVMLPILRDWDFDALITHNRYTLINRNAENMIEFAHTKGIAVLNAAPYNSGILAKGSVAHPRVAYQRANEKSLQRVQKLENICARHAIPLGAAALQFSMRDPRITATICGVSKPERVQETLDWAEWPISETVWQELSAVGFTTSDPESGREISLG